jgi:hypothetical protein
MSLERVDKILFCWGLPVAQEHAILPENLLKCFDLAYRYWSEGGGVRAANGFDRLT